MSSDEVGRQLREAITTGKLAPGTKLAEEPLAAAFAISRPRMREALRELSFAGLVDLVPNRGAFVARPSREDAVAAYAARRLIEEEVVRLAAADPERTVKPLRAHLKRENAARARGDHASYVKLIGEFHLVLAEAAGNRVLADFVAQLVARTSLIIQLYERPAPSPCSTDEHVAIVDMIEKGNARGAAAAMTAHLRAIESRLSFEEPERRTVDFRALFSPPPRERRRAGRVRR